MSLTSLSPTQSPLDAEELGDTPYKHAAHMDDFLQFIDEYDEYDECNELYGHLFDCADEIPTAQDALSGALRYFREDVDTPRGDSRIIGNHWGGIVKALSSDGVRLQSTFGIVFAKLTSPSPSEPT